MPVRNHASFLREEDRWEFRQAGGRADRQIHRQREREMEIERGRGRERETDR
jgi:hypothetical protein